MFLTLSELKDTHSEFDRVTLNVNIWHHKLSASVVAFSPLMPPV